MEDENPFKEAGRKIVRIGEAESVGMFVRLGIRVSQKTFFEFAIWPFMAIWPSDHMRQTWASGVSLERVIKM